MTWQMKSNILCYSTDNSNIQFQAAAFFLLHFKMTVESTLESSAVTTAKIRDLCSNNYKSEVEKIRKCMTIDRRRTSEEGTKCDHEPLWHE